VVLGVLAPALLLWVQQPRYFFNGDTQAAYLGWQFHLGQELLDGRWPLLDPHSWQAGNFAAEGQAGLFSPLAMVVGVVATRVGNVLVFATLLKLLTACAGALGVFALARSYGAVAPLAFVAAVASPLGGMTQYLDLASWVAGLTIWALVPWTWWTLRRTMLADASPIPALALGYLLVTVGYVYGTIMLILVLLVSLAECRLARDRSAALRVLGVGVVCGLVAFTVYLPGVLTGPASNRGAELLLTGKFGSDPLALLASVLPTAVVPDTTLNVLPYAYTAWFLPVLVWLDRDEVRRGWRRVAGLLLMTVAMLLVVLGPAQVGPLRWPLRLQPFLVQMLVVVCAVGLSRYVVRRPSPARLAAGLVWVAAAGLVAVLRYPQGWAWLAAGVVVVAAGVAALWAVARRPWGRSTLLLGAGVAVAVSMVTTVVQHAAFPDAPSPERNLPADAADYGRQLRTAQGDVMVVGGVAALLKADPSANADFLAGSAWYLNPHPVRNTYTTINHRGFRDVFDVGYEGSTQPEVLDTLFSTEPTTGQPRVDLLAVSTLLLVRRDFPPERLTDPPPGWRVSDTTTHAVTWVRDRPVPGAGWPVWSSPGTTVSEVSADDRTTRFRLDEVPADGGRVVVAAIDWPGYRSDVGAVGDPVDGYLLTVDVPGGATGETVTVRFSPPGWPWEVATWWLAVVLALGWTVSRWARHRRAAPRSASSRRAADRERRGP
jgi:hypothetical protein